MVLQWFFKGSLNNFLKWSDLETFLRMENMEPLKLPPEEQPIDPLAC